MPNPEPLRPGDPVRVGDYRLSARLGEGGQGVVYLGTSQAGAKVAVKVLRADLASDEDALERFVREVSVAQRVATFCTAQVIETAVFEGRPYIVSEYIDGPTLDSVVTTEGPRRGSGLHRLAIGTVTALVAIHQAGIVHRDFKPSNVLLGEDGPRVIDFGIARALDRTSTLTSMVIGTPAYMTPEQLAGDPPGPATDMFAWGCTMVFAATGAPPFGTDSLPAVFNRIMHKEPDVSALQEPLRGLVAQCLDKDPGRRPRADEVLMRLLGHAPAPVAPAEPEVILAEGSAAATQISIPGGRPPTAPWAPPDGNVTAGRAQPVWQGQGEAARGDTGPHEPVAPETVRARDESGPAGQAGTRPGGQRGQGVPGQDGQDGQGSDGQGRGGQGTGAQGQGAQGQGARGQGAQGQGGEPGGGNRPVYAEGVTFAHAPAPAAGPYRPPQGPPPAGQAYPYPGVPQPGGGYPGGPYQGGAQPGGQQAAAHHQGGPYAGFQGGPYPGQGGPYQGQGGRPGGPGPWQGQSAPGSSSSSGGNRGLMVALGAIGGVVLLVGGIFLTVTLTNRTGGTSGTGAASPEVFAQTGAPSSSAPASPTPTPMPSPTGTIKLPGLETVVYENADDPIKLSSYRFDEGRNVYLRNGDRFTKTSKYLEIAYNDGMTRFVGTDAQFDTSNYATVSIVDRASGDSRTVRTVKSPQYVWGPAWSPDGTKLLFTVHSNVGGKVSHRGFGIVDTTTGKWTFSRVKDTDVGEWSYFWRGDGQAVGTWAVDGSKEAIRFYNLDGTVQRSLENIGSPLAVSSYDVSPDGTRLLTLCERKGSEVCVWAVADGREAARVRFPTELLIGWYDDDHLAGWRKAGTGYEAVVFDLRGNVVRLLATATEEQYKAAFLQYTRQN